MAKRVMVLRKGSLQGRTARAHGPAQSHHTSLKGSRPEGRSFFAMGTRTFSAFPGCCFPMVPTLCVVFCYCSIESFRFFLFLTSPHGTLLHSHMAPLIAFVCHGSHNVFHPWIAKWLQWLDQAATCLPAERPSPHVSVSWQRHNSINTRLVSALGDAITNREINKKLTIIMICKSLISLGLESDNQIDSVISVLIMEH